MALKACIFRCVTCGVIRNQSVMTVGGTRNYQFASSPLFFQSEDFLRSNYFTTSPAMELRRQTSPLKQINIVRANRLNHTVLQAPFGRNHLLQPSLFLVLEARDHDYKPWRSVHSQEEGYILLRCLFPTNHQLAHAFDPPRTLSRQTTTAHLHLNYVRHHDERHLSALSETRRWEWSWTWLKWSGRRQRNSIWRGAIRSNIERNTASLGSGRKKIGMSENLNMQAVDDCTAAKASLLIVLILSRQYFRPRA